MSSDNHTAETEDDGPECDLCGLTTCPDADLPGFSEPVACAYLPIYEALRYDRCDYGCARDITKATIRRGIVPTVERFRSLSWDEAVVAAIGGGLTHASSQMLRDDNPHRESAAGSLGRVNYRVMLVDPHGKWYQTEDFGTFEEAERRRDNPPNWARAKKKIEAVRVVTPADPCGEAEIPDPASRRAEPVRQRASGHWGPDDTQVDAGSGTSKRMGEPFEKALCAGCGKEIQHIYWGNGGTIWEHANGRHECSEPTVAKPIEGSREVSSSTAKGAGDE